MLPICHSAKVRIQLAQAAILYAYYCAIQVLLIMYAHSMYVCLYKVYSEVCHEILGGIASMLVRLAPMSYVQIVQLQEVLFETLIFDFYFEVIKVKYFRETKPFNIYELFGIRSQISFQPELMVARYEHDTGIRNGKPEYLQEAQCLLYLLAHGESAPSTRIESGHGFKVYQIPIEYKDFGMRIPQEL